MAQGFRNFLHLPKPTGRVPTAALKAFPEPSARAGPSYPLDRERPTETDVTALIPV